MSDPVARLNAALEGRYAIERELGEGGMATVYLAEDLKHQRKVALKVLKPELAAVVGAERFLVEIKTTANLTHPHILPLFDSGEADGFLFYVMPHIEGESLRERIDRDKQLPVDEAVRITTDLAEALDYAHRHKIIHRDIKPANILMHEGRPLIADFGIALAVGVAGGGRLTETGLSLGTPHYMSPEQATGDQSVGAATDTYALACVLYEMLVGEPPYTGSTAQAILGKIIAGKLASASEERESVPVNVDAAIRKALEKLPADRFTSAQGFANALSDIGFRHGEPSSARPEDSARPWPASRTLPWALLAVSAVALVVVGLALWTGRWSPSQAASEITRLSIVLPPGQAVTLRPAISHDGRTVAFTAGGASEPPRLYIKERDEFEWQPVAGTEGAEQPFFSPDDQSVAFFAGGRLFRWDRGGGAPQPLAEAPGPLGGTWGEGDTIVFVPVWNGGLYQVPASGGLSDAEALIIPDGQERYAFVYPRLVPGRNEVLFTAWGPEIAVWRLDLASGDRSVVVA